MAEPFDVTLDLDGPKEEVEQMMFPKDDSLGASVGNIVNCHCVLTAAAKEAEDDKAVWFKVFGLGVVRFDKAESRKRKAESRHGCVNCNSKYSDDQPRDDSGKWTPEGATSASHAALKATNDAYEQSEKASASHSKTEHEKAV